MQNTILFFVLIWALAVLPTQAQSSQSLLPSQTKELGKTNLSNNLQLESLVKKDSSKFNFKGTSLLIDDVNATTSDTTGKATVLKQLQKEATPANKLLQPDKIEVTTGAKTTPETPKNETPATTDKGLSKGKSPDVPTNATGGATTNQAYVPQFKENTLVDRLLPTKLIDSTSTTKNADNRLLGMWKESPQRTTAKDSIIQSPPAAKTTGNIHVIQEATNIIGKHKLVQPRVVQYPAKSESDEATYKARLSALQTIIPMTYNNTVKHFIDMYVYEKRDQVNRMLTRSDMYMTLFEAALDRHGLPAELKYLPIIESALVPHAKSESGRSGLWQLSYATAKEYGLESNNYIDERRDPRLATEAAAMHLKNLYRRYLDWHIVIAAYNCGEAEVNKAIQKAGGVRNYWELATFLDIETQAYVPLFIAATYIMEYYAEHNFHKYEAPYTYYVTDTVFVKKAMTLREVAKQVNMDINELQFLNPAVVRDIIPLSVKGYPLNLPGSKAPVFVSYLNNLANRKEINLDRTKESSIRMPHDNMWNQNPDNFGRISGRARNEIQPASSLLKTVNYGLAGSDTSIIAQYKIRRGDTMNSILQLFPGVSIEDIRRVNNIKGNALLNGMTLKIPAASR